MPPEKFLYVPYQPVASSKYLFPLLSLFRAVRLTQPHEILVPGTGITAVVPCPRL